MDTLGIGIIGSGYMARTFGACLATYNRGATLRAIAGGTRTPTTAAEFGVDAVDSVEELVRRRDVDAVLVTSPHANHLEHCVLAAREGKHVFLEKPMEVSVDRCDRIIRACREAGVTLCLAHVVRFRGATRRGKELIDRGAIGQVRQVAHSWHFVQSPASTKPWTTDPQHGGVFLDAGSHAFDMMRWYVGAEADRVYSVVTNFSGSPTVNPTSMTIVTYRNGAMGKLWMCYELPAPGFEHPKVFTQVVGSTGIVTVDSFGKVKATVDGEWREIWEQPPIDYLVNILNPARLEAFAAELQDFIDSVREGRRPFCTGEDGRAAVEVVEAANLSSRTGQAVTLPLSPPP